MHPGEDGSFSNRFQQVFPFLQVGYIRQTLGQIQVVPQDYSVLYEHFAGCRNLLLLLCADLKLLVIRMEYGLRESIGQLNLVNLVMTQV